MEQRYYVIRDSCASCGSASLELIWEFGNSPLAGYFPYPNEKNVKNMIPMTLVGCNGCSLVQIKEDVSDEILFSDYRYISSVGMNSHFERFATWFSNQAFASPGITILEIGCNDGPLLDALTKKGYHPLGIDPALNIVQRARTKGLEVISDFFSKSAVETYNFENQFDVIISCNSFAHISNILEVAESVAVSLKEQGSFIVEVQSLPALIMSKSVDFIYHEHKYYYSIRSISNLMAKFGLFLTNGELIDTHGGSYRLVFIKGEPNPTEGINRLTAQEFNMDLSFTKISNQIASFFEIISASSNFLIEESNNGKKIICFGASGRGNMLLHYSGLSKFIEYVVDESPERINRQMAFTGLQIKSFNELSDEDYNICLILAWNYFASIQLKWPHRNKILIRPLPTLEKFST